jgi:hypothetical protein
MSKHLYGGSGNGTGNMNGDFGWGGGSNLTNGLGNGGSGFEKPDKSNQTNPNNYAHQFGRKR